MSRLRRALVLWSFLLAPWGGPCERGTRAADPMTIPAIRAEGGVSGFWSCGTDRPHGVPGLPIIDPDIFDDEDDSDEVGWQRALDKVLAWTPLSPRAPCA